MKRRIFFRRAGIFTLISGLFAQEALSKSTAVKECNLKKGEVQHMVIFNLGYPEGSEEATKFLNDGTTILTGIPVVNNFQAFKQVSQKNDYQYGFSMVFSNREDYTTYNNHPDHVAFVRDRWTKEVTDFLEIDFEKSDGSFL
jgi:hypothetical protein